ncbi:phosphatase PAP2 family protein [Tunicatimonas pelagia]|uniref:phosphatase PAP2 family protein n=1 Tax=Tunicatimonas pelagia TaxID=931531 RepID=UPI002665FAC5|nr:phosphatase PAP2 family protein [Tunicatimonas pelagia]WKN44110.1 phosphatase PAP2 family protein [Tunicatimonas pelagia]
MKINKHPLWWFPWGTALFFILSGQYFAYSQGYELKTARETTLLSVGATGTVVGAILRNNRETLKLAEVEELDINDVLALDQLSDGTYREGARITSDVLVGVSLAIPLTLLAFDNARADAGTLGVILLETLAINETLTGITKALAARPRPYTYNSNNPDEIRTMRGNNFSYFSGHTSYAAAMSFFTAKVISDYVDDPGIRAVAWTTAAILPAATGYFRYRAGKHFPTDVITGYVVGASLGYLIPHLHQVGQDRVQLSATVSSPPVMQPMIQVTFVL